uniref:BRCT domain-containing protein n=2 Tax=Bursaphelenchus xylophilus TaxID=6326 RepID=A0A1I7RVJ7_BURXY
MVQDALAENVNVVGVGWLDEIWDRAHTIENGENDFLCEELFSAFPPPEEINVLPGIPVEDAKVNKWVNNITSQVSISTVRDSDTTANQSSHSNNNKENTTPQNSENHRNSTTNRDVTVPTKTPQTSKIAPQDLNRTVDSLDEELIIDDVVMTQDLSGGAPSAVTVIRCTPDLTDVQEEVVLDNSGNEVYDDEAERPKIDISAVNISFESDAPLPEPTEREIISDTLKSTSKRLEDFISSPTQRRLNKLLAETATQAIIVHQDERTDHVGDMEAEEISEVGMAQHNEEDDELSEVESIGSDYQRYLERGAEFSPLASPIEKVPYEKRHFVYTDKKRKRVRIPSPNDSIMSPDFNNENDNFSRSKLKAEPSTRLATALGPPITRRFGHNIVWQDKMFNPNLEMTQQPVLPPTQYSQFLRDVNQRKEQFDSMRQQSNGHN